MKLTQYLSLGLTLLVATSCGNDWLDRSPSTAVETEKSIKQLSDIEFSLNGIYSTMQDPYAYSGRLVYYGDVTGDDMQAVSSTKRTGGYYDFRFSRDTGPSTHWNLLYAMIQGCNLILNNIDAINVGEDDAAYRDDLKGEALAIRGLALFDLTRIFGYPYLKDNGASLGVPIVKEFSTIESRPARNTVAECYEAIIADLKESTTLLSSKFKKGKINRWAAMTLLSRVYLYKGDNANALQYAEESIKGAKKAKYALWTNEEYPTAWGNDASSSKPGEVLFEIVNLTTDSPGKESMGYLNSYNGYDDMCITVSFYKLLKEDPDDVRLKLLSFDKTYYAYVNKYQPQEGENIADANIPLIRLSEAYLNAAEAAVKLGDNEKAVAYLNPIVARANPARSVEGRELTLDDVLTERRKELVAEGHRMYDVMRNGGTVKRVQLSDKAISKTKHDTKYMEYDWTFYQIVLPIPKGEMNANPNMKQNPGY
ncbi:MAG: RagB/SusD family nutrient uptake outer membrane protein [Bacteroides sp.]